MLEPNLCKNILENIFNNIFRELGAGSIFPQPCAAAGIQTRVSRAAPTRDIFKDAQPTERQLHERIRYDQFNLTGA